MAEKTYWSYLKIRRERWPGVDAHLLQGDDGALFLFHEGVLDRNGLMQKVERLVFYQGSFLNYPAQTGGLALCYALS